MPKRAARICSFPGCPEIAVEGGRCRKHREMYHAQSYRAWYRTERWRTICAQQLQREPWCAECLRAGEMKKATDVDHINPHQGNEAKFWAGPFQSLCHAHHSQKTQRELRVGA
jgi:5-methylcytosine-specific restriction endonuclease McrA